MSKCVNEIKIPKNIFNCLIENKNFKIYNTKEEQEEYIQKWESRLTDDYIVK